MSSQKKINGLYAIVDPQFLKSRTLLDTVHSLLKGGVRLVQLRDKINPHSIKVEEALQIKAFKKEFSFLFIINDDPLLAKEVDADGVHVGQEDICVSEARAILGPNKVIGKSTHSLVEAETALKEDVNYIAVGAIYSTSSKPEGHPVVGIECLQNICKKSTKPVVAIGGINRSNIAEVVSAGVSSVAMISALCSVDNVEAEARFYSSFI